MENIKSRYDKMLETIENANIYDGRGTYDLYRCKCGAEMFTTYDVKGVTPFCIGCKCGNVMSHIETFKTVPDYIRVTRWVRPSFEQLKYLSLGQIDHVLNGGLVLSTDLRVNIELKYPQPIELKCPEPVELMAIDRVPKRDSQPWAKRGKNSRKGNGIY